VDYHRNGSPDLRERLVKRHLPLARRLAARFARRGVPYDDLYQVASIGLIHAVDRFDPERGIPFDVYAAPTIVGEIKHHFRDRSWDLRVPRRVQELHLAVNAAIERLATQLGRSPTIGELAQAVGAADEDIVEAIDAGGAFNTQPILGAAPGSDDGPRHGADAILGSDDGSLDGVEDRLMITRLIDECPPREALILRMYFWDRRSQSLIAERLGISQMHVSRLLRRSIERMRVAFETDESSGTADRSG
jgi:RNA polymerase sigma-B factor